MGEAKRRKLLGLYPDDSKPENRPLPVGPTGPAEITRVCESCQKPGGTLVMIENGKYVHSPAKSTYRTYMSLLRRRGLAQSDSENVQASAALFEGGR